MYVMIRITHFKNYNNNNIKIRMYIQPMSTFIIKLNKITIIIKKKNQSFIVSISYLYFHIKKNIKNCTISH